MDLTPFPAASPFPGEIFYIQSTGSTMELARALTEQVPGPKDGTVILAGEQTRGRGRLASRTWNAQADQNLLFTFLLASAGLRLPLPVFPLAAGLAVARTLEGEGLEPKIKWPNDVYVRGRKVCGILCETAGDWLSAGIGLNCNQRDFPPELREKASSLALLSGREYDRTALLESFLRELSGVLREETWREALEARLLGIGREVLLLEGTAGNPTPLRGRISGVGDRGELLFRPEGEDVRGIFAGEILYES